MTPILEYFTDIISHGSGGSANSEQWVILAFMAMVFGSGSYLHTRRPRWRVYAVLLALIIAAFAIGLQAAVATDITGISLWGMSGDQVEFPLTPIVIAVYCIVGALIGPIPALLVGLAYGFGRYFWHSPNPYEIISFALVAFFVGILLRQRIGGTVYNLLRVPIVAAPLGAMMLVTLAVFSTTFASVGDVGLFRALDKGLLTALGEFPVFVIDALLGGLLATLALLLVGRLSNGWSPSISRVGRRLDTNLVTFYLLLAILFIPIIATLTYNLPRQLATSELSNEMVYQSHLVATNVRDFLDKEKDLLLQASHEVAANEAETLQPILPFLSLLLYAGEYENLFVVGEDLNNPLAVHDNPTAAELTYEEIQAVSSILSSEIPGSDNTTIVVSDDSSLSLAVRVPDTQQTVLVGRLAIEHLRTIAASGSGSLAESIVNVIDDTGRMLITSAENDSLMPDQWPADSKPVPVLAIAESAVPPMLLELPDSDEAYLTIASPVEGYPWQVNIAVPEELMVQQSLTNAGSLAVLLLFSSVIAAFFLLFVTRSIRKPLTELELATQQLASGNLDYPINRSSGDEIGRLVLAFRQMRESVRRRQIEQQLLVELSQSAFRTLDLETGIPQILKAAIQATNASSARFVVYRSGNEKRLEFSQGPLSAKAAALDTKVLALLNREDSFELNSPEQVSAALRLKSGSPVPGTILALRLLSPGGFDGAFWLAFKEAANIEADQRQFLGALMQQMLLLLENARMFALNAAGKQELEAVLRSAADAVVVTDAAQRVRLVNEAAERFFGFRGNEVVGQALSSVDSLSPLADAVEKSRPGLDYIEVEVDRNRTLAVRVSELNGRDGSVVGRVAVLHDISRFKESDQAKSELIANISHDLRTPLSYIYNYATLIPTAGSLMPIQEEWLGKILTGVNRMNELVDNLLDIRRLQSDRGLIVADVHIKSLLEQVVHDWRPVAQAHGLEISLSVEEKLPMVQADAEILSRSVRNLVSNAVKYAPDSGRLDINGSYILGNVIISVRDRGPGIPEEDLERIFEEFYRSDKHKNNGVKGTGLGLALVRAATERHGGRVWCESRSGQGSTFIISIPAKDTNPFSHEDSQGESTDEKQLFADEG